MEQLTLLLFERMGVLLLLTFILTRIPLFRQLLDREFSLRTSVYFSIIFGLFGMAGNYAGVVVDGNQLLASFWIFPIETEQAIAHSGLVGVVIGGLLGGPIVGLGAGLLSGAHLYSLGGMTALASGLAGSITGLLAGWIARFFSQERVISPSMALFFGMFAPILYMGLILIFTTPPEKSIALVNLIGIPMVLTNSVSIAIFTTMIHIALREEERAAAFETQRALKIAELALPHLRQGLTPETAEATARLLMKELKAEGVAVTNTDTILAHVGLGTSHHLPGQKIQTELSRKAIYANQIQIARDKRQIQCTDKDCPLKACIIVPFSQAGRVAGLIKLYFRRPQQIRAVEEVLAKGLGKLISSEMNLVLAEKMTLLMKDAELRLLQAQINPHFLFNTLNSIVTLIRIDPDLARHMTVQLGVFMRFNLKVTSSQLISIHQELDHLNAYLEIVKVRFADQLTVHSEIEPGLEDVLIPPATFQPLVENSIIHGLKGRPYGGMVKIQLRQSNGRLVATVLDNGSGIPAEIIEHLGDSPINSNDGNGIGVHNVNQRLISLLGEESRLHIQNLSDEGCQISFSLPLRVQKEGALA